MSRLQRRRRGVVITRITSIADYATSAYTRYKVIGLNGGVYTITVDSGGLCSCTCQASKFRGDCYHVAILQMEFNKESLLHHLKPIEPVSISKVDFARYYAQERFVAERIFLGQQQYLVFGHKVYLQDKPTPRWQFNEFQRYAGTILEGAWERKGVDKFYLFDCPFFKGQDLTHSSLAERRDKLEGVFNKFKHPSIALSPYVYTPEDKKLMESTYGNILLKDVTATYNLTGKSPRAFMIKART